MSAYCQQKVQAATLGWGRKGLIHPASSWPPTPSLSYRQSYDISIVAQVDQTGSKSSNLLDLKNPFFRYEGPLACIRGRGLLLACSPLALPMRPSLLQIHRHDTLTPSWLPLHIPLREHVEHRQHLQPQQWDDCDW